jgi:hypothetical protein
VRLPGFKELRCPRNVTKGCTLTGSNLFLVTEIGVTADLANAAEVAPDFTGTTLMVPNGAHAGGTETLYVRLRDDPGTVQVLTLPVTAMTQPGMPVQAAAPLPAATVAVPAPVQATQPEGTPAPGSGTEPSAAGASQPH